MKTHENRLVMRIYGGIEVGKRKTDKDAGHGSPGR